MVITIGEPPWISKNICYSCLLFKCLHGLLGLGTGGYGNCCDGYILLREFHCLRRKHMYNVYTDTHQTMHTDTNDHMRFVSIIIQRNISAEIAASIPWGPAASDRVGCLSVEPPRSSAGSSPKAPSHPSADPPCATIHCLNKVVPTQLC